MIKVKNNIAPEIIKELFTPKIIPFGLLTTIRFRERDLILSDMALNQCPIKTKNMVFSTQRNKII